MLVKRLSPAVSVVILVIATFALQIRELAALLGTAVGSLTDPIYLVAVIAISLLAAFKTKSLVVGFGAVAVAALLISIYVAFVVHPKLGVHSSAERQVYVWFGRFVGGSAVFSFIWAIAGLFSVSENQIND